MAIENPQSLHFKDARTLLESFGFHISRTRGSHHIFVHPMVPELVNLQEVSGNAKAYQIRQFMKLVERYNLMIEESK